MTTEECIKNWATELEIMKKESEIAEAKARRLSKLLRIHTVWNGLGCVVEATADGYAPTIRNAELANLLRYFGVVVYHKGEVK